MREEPLYTDARAVARETMRRARQNIETIIERLDTLGYQFNNSRTARDPLAGVVFALPRTNVARQIAKLEQRAGTLPLSLRAWYEIVGNVDLAGAHPNWPAVRFDPLVIAPIEYGILEFDEFHGDEAPAAGATFHFSIAPDEYHKANISGDTYDIALPNTHADALLLKEWHHTTFVHYLRICFRWGGFPGFARYNEWPQHDVSYLAEGLTSL